MNRKKVESREKNLFRTSGRIVSNSEQLYRPGAVQNFVTFLKKLAAAGDRGASFEWLRRLIHAPMRA
jgi:hypothetical protein